MQRLFFEILFPSNYFAGKIIKIIKCYEYEIFVRYKSNEDFKIDR